MAGLEDLPFLGVFTCVHRGSDNKHPHFHSVLPTSTYQLPLIRLLDSIAIDFTGLVVPNNRLPPTIAHFVISFGPFVLYGALSWPNSSNRLRYKLKGVFGVNDVVRVR